MKVLGCLGDGAADDSLESPKPGVSAVPGIYPGSVTLAYSRPFHLFEMKLGHGINMWPVMVPGLPPTQG